MTLASLAPLWPELIIAASAMILLMLGVFPARHREQR